MPFVLELLSFGVALAFFWFQIFIFSSNLYCKNCMYIKVDICMHVAFLIVVAFLWESPFSASMTHVSVIKPVEVGAHWDQILFQPVTEPWATSSSVHSWKFQALLSSCRRIQGRTNCWHQVPWLLRAFFSLLVAPLESHPWKWCFLNVKGKSCKWPFLHACSHSWLLLSMGADSASYLSHSQEQGNRWLPSC